MACSNQVYRLNGVGGVVQTYALGANLFALNLDPDNKTFWTADFGTGEAFHVDIATGAVIASFNAGANPFLGGLAVVGEITASTLNTPPPATTSYYVRTRDPVKLAGMGASLARAQLAGGTAQDQVVALPFGDATIGVDRTGQPQYGATGFSRTTPLSFIDIATLVESYAFGYYGALSENTTLHVRIVVGTNNHGKNVTSTHGAAWGRMVNAIASTVVAAGLSSQVDIAGGFDAEVGYNDPVTTRAWIDGYSSLAHAFFTTSGIPAGRGVRKRPVRTTGPQRTSGTPRGARRPRCRFPRSSAERTERQSMGVRERLRSAES